MIPVRTMGGGVRKLDDVLHVYFMENPLSQAEWKHMVNP